MIKRLALMALLFAAVALPHLAQAQIRLSNSDQQRFDSYYSRWQSYKATNNQSEVRSMEGRMQDVYRHYNIPGNTPYGRVASNGGGGGWRSGGWNGAPAPTSGPGPYMGRPEYREHDHDWERRREWEREHAREEHREWERREAVREHERQEARHDNGLHKGWYKDHDHDHDRDHDREHHDRDHRDHDHDHDHDRDHH